MTPWHEGPITGAAREQQQLWGADPDGWARLAEPHTRPLFEAVLAAAGVTAGIRLLDVGCGSGLLLDLAQRRGAVVTGLDVAPGLLAAAHDRVPSAALWLADLQRLPFPNGSFDASHGRERVPVRGRPPGSAPRGGPGRAARRARGGQHVRRARRGSSPRPSTRPCRRSARRGGRPPTRRTRCPSRGTWRHPGRATDAHGFHQPRTTFRPGCSRECCPRRPWVSTGSAHRVDQTGAQ